MPQNTGELCDDCDSNRVDSLVSSRSTCTQQYEEPYSWSLEALSMCEKYRKIVWQCTHISCK